MKKRTRSRERVRQRIILGVRSSVRADPASGRRGRPSYLQGTSDLLNSAAFERLLLPIALADVVQVLGLGGHVAHCATLLFLLRILRLREGGRRIEEHTSHNEESRDDK